MVDNLFGVTESQSVSFSEDGGIFRNFPECRSSTQAEAHHVLCDGQRYHQTRFSRFSDIFINGQIQIFSNIPILT